MTTKRVGYDITGRGAERLPAKGEPMKVKRIDHVGIAVRDKEKAARFLTEALGARKVLDEPWEFRGQGFNWAYFDVGESGRVELISSPDPASFINQYIDKRGEGLHHVTIQVEDLAEAVSSLRAMGIEPVDINTSDPTWKEAFIAPRDSFGVLIQLAEFDEDYWADRMIEEK
jgi:methylmalonyl-CoA/ethylmalonyl-CoA epimerase